MKAKAKAVKGEVLLLQYSLSQNTGVNSIFNKRWTSIQSIRSFSKDLKVLVTLLVISVHD